MASRDYKRAALYVQQLYETGKKFPAWTKDRADFWSESFYLFIKLFLRPNGEVPWFHKEWCWLVARYQYLCILAPRDHAKSSLLAIYYPLWRIYMDHNATMMIVTSSADVSGDEVGSIKTFVTQSESLIAGFGLIGGENADKWSGSEFFLPRTDITLKDPTVIGLGVGSSILSRRVVNGAIIGDDLVKDTEVQTHFQRDRVSGWINGVLIPVAEPTEQIIFIGTRKSEDDYYDRLMEGKEMHALHDFARTNDAEKSEDGFKVVVYDAQPDELDPGKVLWKEKWTEKALAEKKATIGTLQFGRNYRNKVSTSETSLFPIEWFERCYDSNATILHTHYTTEIRKVIAVDLAIGIDESSAFFVALVIGLEKPSNNFKLLHMVRKRTGFLDQVKIIVSLFDRFLPEVVVVESNGYQAAMAQALQGASAAMVIVPYFTDKRKHSEEEGIPALQPVIEQGRFKLPMGSPDSRAMSEVLVNEFNRYGTGEFSDTVMASWFGIMRLMGKRPMGVGAKATIV